MCRSNTNSRMAVVSSKTSQRPLNPYAQPFIRSTITSVAAPPQQHFHQYHPHTSLVQLTPVAIYPHLLSASALIHHPNLKYPTLTINKNKKNTRQHSKAAFKVTHLKKKSGSPNICPKFRGGRLFVPPKKHFSAPVPEKIIWMKKLVSEVDCKKTSVMMKNIPNQYRRDDLLEFIDKFCLQNHMQYDFLYLPMDFKRHNNKGYAFINFTKPNHARVFKELMNGYKWGWVYLRNTHFKSNKTCEITWAKIQGKKGLVRHFRNSNFPCYSKKYLPVELNPPSNGSSSPSTLTIVGRCLSYI